MGLLQTHTEYKMPTKIASVAGQEVKSEHKHYSNDALFLSFDLLQLCSLKALELSR